MEKKEKGISRTTLVMGFIIFDLIVLLIALLSTRLEERTDILNLISLASGFASILLALVAIVYAFFQQFNSGKQSERVQGTLDKIDEKIDELKEIKEGFKLVQQEVASFRSETKTEWSQLINLVTTLEENQKAQIDNVLSTLKERHVDIPLEVEQDLKDEADKNNRTIFERMKEAILGEIPVETTEYNFIKMQVREYIEKIYTPGSIIKEKAVVEFIVNNFGNIVGYKVIKYSARNILLQLSDTEDLVKRSFINGIETFIRI